MGTNLISRLTRGVAGRFLLPCSLGPDSCDGSVASIPFERLTRHFRRPIEWFEVSVGDTALTLTGVDGLVVGLLGPDPTRGSVGDVLPEQTGLGATFGIPFYADWRRISESATQFPR